MHDEELEQIKALDWIRFHYPALGKSVIHIANQRRCSLRYGHILNKMGLRKGVSDLFWPKPIGFYHGLFIEVKTDSGKPTKEQKEFLKEVNEDGYYGVFAYGGQQIIDVFCDYFGFKKGRIDVYTSLNKIDYGGN